MENILFCKYCQLDKPETDFYRSKTTSRGFQIKCKQCTKQYKEQHKNIVNLQARERYQKNIEKELSRGRKYREENRNAINKRAQNSYDKNKRHNFYEKNKELHQETNKRWRINNREKYRKYQREWTKNKRATDPAYAIEHRLRNRMLDGLKSHGAYKVDSYRNLVGCTRDELKDKMIALFTEGMTWEKFLDGEIEIDHKKPCCAFDLTIEEHQRECFHYSNLQPLWAKDNEAKIAEDLKQRLK